MSKNPPPSKMPDFINIFAKNSKPVDAYYPIIPNQEVASNQIVIAKGQVLKNDTPT